MIKVFETLDILEAGRIRSLLEAHDIDVFMKNEFAGGALGDLPFLEVAPQLFVVNDDDAPAARRLIREDGSEVAEAR
ncbi:DUF2007 domain-containing protein [Marinihelvus fidelis]|uniref:DUF2007 domain-containing protein n=1 Tax=Marinihelvus fidelis TaxID=2613842 RepID=A0A5N0T7K6_9GAMM|nr:DUF2007 domain-containing protein [Marinihelvus fidelis]KAA9130484.1 DUF2007 domain-containing protein [Marinihelvus fidelis]